jgi:hypothetical protein
MIYVTIWLWRTVKEVLDIEYVEHEVVMEWHHNFVPGHKVRYCIPSQMDVIRRHKIRTILTHFYPEIDGKNLMIFHIPLKEFRFA